MRKLQREQIDLNQVVTLTIEQAKARYNIGYNTLYKVAEQAGAIIKIGRRRLFSRKKLDEYFQNLTNGAPNE
mgnify:CR=1 FL=1